MTIVGLTHACTIIPVTMSGEQTAVMTGEVCEKLHVKTTLFCSGLLFSTPASDLYFAVMHVRQLRPCILFIYFVQSCILEIEW